MRRLCATTGRTSLTRNCSQKGGSRGQPGMLTDTLNERVLQHLAANHDSPAEVEPSNLFHQP